MVSYNMTPPGFLRNVTRISPLVLYVTPPGSFTSFTVEEIFHLSSAQFSNTTINAKRIKEEGN